MKKKTTAEFQEELNNKFPGEFKLLSEYTGRVNSIVVKNLKSGDIYKVLPKSLLMGRGKKPSRNQKFSNEEVQEIINDKLGDKSSYTLISEYTSLHKPIELRCERHGVSFKTTLLNIQRKANRCPMGD